MRISHNVKKNMLKENAMYEKAVDEAAADVALTSKDMEVNFSNKQQQDEDDDTIDSKEAAMPGDPRLIKADSMDIIDDTDLRGVVQGMPPEDIKIVEKMKILEE